MDEVWTGRAGRFADIAAGKGVVVATRGPGKRGRPYLRGEKAPQNGGVHGALHIGDYGCAVGGADLRPARPIADVCVNGTSHGTADTVTVTPKHGVGTGIVGSDRSTTIGYVRSGSVERDSPARPRGSVAADDGGVLRRLAHRIRCRTWPGCRDCAAGAIGLKSSAKRPRGRIWRSPTSCRVFATKPRSGVIASPT